MLVDTLYVVVGQSYGEAALADVVDAVEWGGGSSKAICVVDANYSAVNDLRVWQYYRLARSTHVSYLGMALQGLSRAVATGIIYRQVIILTDDCLIRNVGLGDIFLPYTQAESIGVIGVEEFCLMDEAYKQLLQQWGLQRDLPLADAVMLSDACVVLSGQFVQQLQKRNLLEDLAAATTGSLGISYLTYVSKALGFNNICWGNGVHVLPPVYIAKSPISPLVLSEQILLVAPLSRVYGYSSSDLRQLYASARASTLPSVSSPVLVKPRVV